MKTGIIGAEPKDFYDELREAYDATLVLTQWPERPGGTRKPLTPQQRKRVNAATERLARTELSAGKDVLYDGRLNLYARREQVREKVAEPVGAQTILLCVNAPVWLRQKRLGERAERNFPDDEQLRMSENIDLVKAMKTMQRNVEWPNADEAHLRLDGALPTDVLLRQTYEYVLQQLTAGSA